MAREVTRNLSSETELRFEIANRTTEVMSF